MTVQELASAINEIYRKGDPNLPVFMSINDMSISYPLQEVVHAAGPAVNYVKLIYSMNPSKIPIKKADLERAERATFNPDEEQKDQ